MIAVEQLTMEFGGRPLFDSISFLVNAKDRIALVGKNGAGKTTLLQILGTLDTPDSGSIVYNGVDVLKLKSNQLANFRNRNIGFVFQFHQLLPEFSSLENVAIPALLGGDKQSDAMKRAAELLDYLGLSQRLHHKPAQLSGGGRQRVAVARALINRPGVILADEPSGSLDSANKRDLHRLFFNLRDEMNQTFVIVTHDESLAHDADRVLHMRDGVIVNDEKNDLII